MRAARLESVAWVMLIMLSASLHLFDLGSRSFHSDEAIHAQAAYDLLHQGNYRYDPTYHGPLLYYLTATSYALFGDNDFTARLPIALCGIAAIGLAFRLRHLFSPWAAWWAGLLFTISPTLLYYGRFLRMDMLALVTSGAALLCLHSALKQSALRMWTWFGVWTALTLATKENAYVTATLVVAVLGMLLPRSDLFEKSRSWIHAQCVGLAIAGLVVVIITVPLYTAFFRYPEDWFFPLKAVAYWSHQHKIERVAGPMSFYLPRLGLYEFLPLVAASVWVWRRAMRIRSVEAFLYLFGLSSILMYAYLGEKVPWLATHQIWPFLPLAGAQLAHTFSPSGSWWGRSLATAALGLTLLSSVVANFVLDELTPLGSRTEALMYVQTTPELREVAMKGLRLSRQVETGGFVAAVDGIGVWPLRWYWRHLPIWWSSVKPGLEPELVVTNLDGGLQAKKLLGPGYVTERVPLRAWWSMQAQWPTLQELVRYMLTRVPWGDIGSSDILVLERREPLRNSVRSVPTPAALAALLPIEETLVFGEQWLLEPRGISASNGKIAVADTGFSRIVLFAEGGAAAELVELTIALSEPEDVAWHPEGTLLVADTWAHQILEVDVGASKTARVLSLPGPLYGPRSIAINTAGRIAIVDTGNKRVLVSNGLTESFDTIGGSGREPGRLDEPVGAAWVDEDRLVLADVGNRRLQLLDSDGQVLRVVELPDAWPSYHSRPQVAVIHEDLWVVTDPPNAGLWVVRGPEVTFVALSESNIQPAGIAWDPEAQTIYLSDLTGKIWALRIRR